MRNRRERLSPLGFIWTLIKIAFVFVLCFLATAAVFTFKNIASEIPSEKTIENYAPSEPTRILSYDNVVLAVISTAENRESVPISAVPQNLKNATIAIEDSSFYSHAAMSFRGTMRALWADISKRSFTQGGSTITQELARNLENSSGHSYTGRQKSIARKIDEAILAMQLERHYSKDEILELYLNQIFYGSQAYGVQAAAETYFGKKVGGLDLAEAALIAGLPQRPTQDDPYRHPDLAIRRRNIVLARMLQLGYVTPAQEEEARNEKPHFHRMQTAFSHWKAPYFVDYILRQLTQRYGDDMVHRGGLTVYTTLNYKMQAAAEKAVNDVVQQAREAHKNIHQMALVSIDQHTGYVKAMVGGVGPYERNQYNRAIHPRQPGSSFKLFDYTALLETGETPEDGMDDHPASYYAGRGKWWSPVNYDGKYRGWVTFRDALAYSENTVAVKVANQVGIRKIIALALKMGVHSDPYCDNRPLSAYLPTAIGASAIAPLEMCVGYATTATGGVMHPPKSILHVVDHNGATLYDAGPPVGHRVVPADIAAEMNDMLHSVVQYGTGTKANIFPQVWGKTGTTQDDRDAWWIGFTPELTTAVWAGNDRYLNHMLDVFGGSVCASAWDQYMKVAVPLVQKYHRENALDQAAQALAQQAIQPPASKSANGAGKDSSRPGLPATSASGGAAQQAASPDTTPTALGDTQKLPG
ncbi:MAG TPA: PBP1A family penicillin-binding protein [Armatimonadota bacterium]|nr:PBP1A family penicillin-binding protein [Armatimonadota bacterium]